jgi:hypothetical protein
LCILTITPLGMYLFKCGIRVTSNGTALLLTIGQFTYLPVKVNFRSETVKDEILNKFSLGDVLGFHCYGYEDGCLLGRCTI